MNKCIGNLCGKINYEVIYILIGYLVRREVYLVVVWVSNKNSLTSSCWYLPQENKSIIKRRLAYIKGSAQELSQFVVLVRGIPWSAEESYSTSLKKYFTKYYPSSYLSHQMVYHSGKIEKLMVCYVYPLVDCDLVC